MMTATGTADGPALAQKSVRFDYRLDEPGQGTEALPDPGPAMTRRGPSPCPTISRCAAFMAGYCRSS